MVLKYVYILRSLTTIKEGDWVLLLFLLILFAGTETRLYHDLSLMVVINGTHATADISVKVMSLACWNMNIHKYMFIIIIPRKDIVHRLPYMVT